ncbi:hypothetical protein CLI92_05550 [Vandammella animalimorsus]|uniref:DUF4148 domain-containing protein n=1 Tax=Vandammella animalimorsus TaxID=2029117 RepID=A0A2A2T5U0_9BURK|nr:hypothetical protein [Vandammella animalimorsus]PAT32042.1 hypothetical protein CK626_06340 [Vandammella animalimorsus]PAX17013.1 hypothetical protein CLI92_05550 [Vandammella animalimorsus]PAX18986.1 hypothetical protein CLI93_09480 [Vandammella animalimorsus]
MNRRLITTAPALAALLLAGHALAAQSTPAAGEGPLFSEPQQHSQQVVERAAVHAEALAQRPAAGEASATAALAQPASRLTRAEVRSATRDALAQGYHLRVGDAS